jgi:pentatricopeptide repeat protein
LASAYSGAKRYTEALSVYDKMIEMDEKNATAYLRKGFVLNMLNDKEGAANSMKRSCELGEKTACNFVKLNQSNKH